MFSFANTLVLKISAKIVDQISAIFDFSMFQEAYAPGEILLKSFNQT